MRKIIAVIAIIVSGILYAQTTFQKRYFGNTTADGGWISSLIVNSDSGFTFTGYACEFPTTCGFSLVRTDSLGSIVWAKLFPDSIANDLVQTSDGGFIVAGCSSTTIGMGDIDCRHETSSHVRPGSHCVPMYCASADPRPAP